MGLERAALGTGHGLELLEPKEHLDAAVTCRVWAVLCGARDWI